MFGVKSNLSTIEKMDFDNYYLDLTDDEDFLALAEMELNLREPWLLRQRPNNFQNCRNNEFVNRFRFSKPVVRFMINKLHFCAYF